MSTPARMFSRGGTTAQWAASDAGPSSEWLQPREIGINTSTGEVKVGSNPVQPWSILRAINAPSAVYFSAYNAVQGANFAATPVTLPISTTRSGATGDFVLAANQVTVNETGTYRIAVDVSLLVTAGGGTNGAEAWLERNAVEEPGTRTSEMVGTSAGGSGSISAIINVTTGDVFRVRAQRTSGGAALAARANGIRFNMEQVF